MAKKITFSDLRKKWCSGCKADDNYRYLLILHHNSGKNSCQDCCFFKNGTCPEYMELTGQSLTTYNFESLINGVRKKELTKIFAELMEDLPYPEEEICRVIVELTEENGHKKGNKLWLVLKKKFPGKTFSVDTFNLILAVDKIVHKKTMEV